MRFVMFTYPDPEVAAAWEGKPVAERQAIVDEHMAWFDRHRQKIDGGEELERPGKARTVRRRAGEPLITDGPFTESKEIVGGFVILDGIDWEEAQALALEWPSLRNPRARVELWPVWERTPEV
jgi:hypothetical protein